MCFSASFKIECTAEGPAAAQPKPNVRKTLDTTSPMRTGVFVPDKQVCLGIKKPRLNPACRHEQSFSLLRESELHMSPVTHFRSQWLGSSSRASNWLQRASAVRLVNFASSICRARVPISAMLCGSSDQRRRGAALTGRTTDNRARGLSRRCAPKRVEATPGARLRL